MPCKLIFISMYFACYHVSQKLSFSLQLVQSAMFNTKNDNSHMVSLLT